MTLKPIEKLPDGWKFDERAVTAPKGYKWANNGKSRFSPDYRQALVKVGENSVGENSVR